MADLNEWLSVDYPNGGGSTIVNLTIQPNYDGDRTQRLKIQGLKKTVFVDVEQSVANTEEIDREYFYIHFEEPNSSFKIEPFRGDDATFVLDIDYSFDGVNWEKKLVNRYQPTFTLGNNKRIYLRNNTKTLNSDVKDTTYQIELKNRAKVGGNILSLAEDNNFAHLFRYNTYLTDASNLIFPDYVERNCYASMFIGCTNLLYPPQLPATVLAEHCYESMFTECTNLQYAPELPATTLGNGCYENMFSGCTSLVTAPDLPATNLAIFCYRRMFYACTSLVNAPQLPAKVLQNSCYSYMFNGCTNLQYIKMLGVSYIEKNITYWVENVSPTGTFVKKKGVTFLTGVSGIPDGWEVIEID